MGLKEKSLTLKIVVHFIFETILETITFLFLLFEAHERLKDERQWRKGLCGPENGTFQWFYV